MYFVFVSFNRHTYWKTCIYMHTLHICIHTYVHSFMHSFIHTYIHTLVHTRTYIEEHSKEGQPCFVVPCLSDHTKATFFCLGFFLQNWLVRNLKLKTLWTCSLPINIWLTSLNPFRTEQDVWAPGRLGAWHRAVVKCICYYRNTLFSSIQLLF